MPVRSSLAVVTAAAVGLSVCAFAAMSSIARGETGGLNQVGVVCTDGLVTARRLAVTAVENRPSAKPASPSCGTTPIDETPTTTVTRPTVPPTTDASVPGWVTVGDESASYTDDRTSHEYFFFDPDDHDDPTWNASRIGWVVECDSVKFEQIDPMVSPGVTSHHLHEFFGNGNIDASSGTRDFVDTSREDIACSDVNDKSPYWSPAAYQGGQRLTADLFKAYYKSTTPDTVPIPLGLRMVAGNAAATGNQPTQVGWFEEQRTDDLTPREDLTNTIGATEMITRQNPDVNLVLRINFPNCWDGAHLDSPDHQSHMAYFDEKSSTCPATHPVKIPQLTTFTQYDTDGGAGFSLASGEWYSFHQDFWNAWSPDQMAELNQKCIQAELNCRVRGSNALKKLGQYSEFVPTAD